MRYLLFSFFVLFLFACGTENGEEIYEEEISKIESWLSKLDELETKFEQVDTTVIQSNKEQVEQNLLNMKRYYKAEKVDTALARTMNNYKGIKKSAGKMHNERVAIRKELNYTKNQLNNLLADLKSNAQQKEDVEKFMLDEENAFHRLEQGINTYLVKAEYIVNEFERSHPLVQHIVDSVVQVNKQ